MTARIWLLEQECYSVALSAWAAVAAGAAAWIVVRRRTRNAVRR